MQSGGKEKSTRKKNHRRHSDQSRELEAVRREVLNQLSPKTWLQRLAAETVAFCCWQLEAELSSQAHCRSGGKTQGEPAPDTTIPNSYGMNRQGLRAANVFLTTIISEFDEHPVLSEEQKEAIRKGFGDEFVSDLCEWVPTSWDAVLLADQLTRHAKTFKPPLPEIPQSDVKDVIPDPMQGKQMVLKLLRQKVGHLQDLSRIVGLKVSAVKRLDSSPGGSELDSYKATMHELKRAVVWFKYLQRSDL